MDKFDNKYRIESHRLYGWNYSGDGIYFITLVIQSREPILGAVEDQKMVMSDFGRIVHTEWFKSFEIRTELFLDGFVIMPNHLHALIILKNPDTIVGGGVETHGRASLPINDWPDQTETNPLRLFPRQHFPVPSEFHRKPKSISSFIAGFKSATTTQIDNFIDSFHLQIPKFNAQNKLWQPNYYDHIVRDEEEYRKIKSYIKNNPTNWNTDKFNDFKSV